ncbi:MAG: tetratricopeptide repeat protein [Isosphaeraceae bacterium]
MSVGSTPNGPPRRGAWIAVGLSLAAVAGWIAWSTGRSTWLRAQVDSAVRETDWPTAATALDRYLWYRPGDTEAIRTRVEIAEHLGDRAGAVAWLARVPDSAPEAASAQFRRGVLLKEMFRLREAEAAFLAAMERDPDALEPRRELVAILGVLRRATEQEEALWGLLQAGGAIEALRLLAQSSVVIPPGTFAKTIDEGLVLERALQVDPDHPDVRPALGRFHRMRGETAKALTSLEVWLDDHPGDADARVEWLACLLDDGQVDAATPWFDPPRSGMTHLADYRRLRGDWQHLQGRPEKALNDYREAVRLAPRDAEARYRLALGLRAAGKLDEARKAMAYHQTLRSFAEVAAAVSVENPDLAKVVEASETCRALGPDRGREAEAWSTLADRLRRRGS